MGTSEYIRDGADGAAAQPPNAIPQMPGADWVGRAHARRGRANVNVSGRLAFKEPVRIEGNFRGDLSSNELVVISDHGSVEGRVRTPRLLVLGAFRGDITDSRLVVLGPHARVSGRIETDILRVARAHGSMATCGCRAGNRRRASGASGVDEARLPRETKRRSDSLRRSSSNNISEYNISEYQRCGLPRGSGRGDAGGLAREVAQVVQTGAAHFAMAQHLDFLEPRRVQRENALDADSVGYLAHGEGRRDCPRDSS